MDDINLGLALAGVLMLIGLQRMRLGHPAFPWFASGLAAAMLAPVLLGGGEHQVLMLTALGLGLGLALLLGLLSSLSDLPARLALLHGMAGAAIALLASQAMLEQILEPGLSQGLALLSLLLGTFAASGAAVAHLRLSHLLPRVLRHASQSWIGVALLLATLVLGGLLTHGLAEQNLWLMVFLALAATSGIVFSLPLAEREAPLAAAWLGVLTGSGMALLGLALGLAPLLASGVLAAMLTLSLSVALGRRVNLPLSRLLWGAKRDAEKSADSESLMPEAMSMDELAARLQQNHEILLIPGFGCMAAEACGALVQLAQTLSDAGHKVYLLAHPLAGRLPGQLALLLREAGATGEQLLEHWPEDKPIPPLTLSIGAHDLIHPQRAGLGVPDLRLQNLDTEARVVLILSQVQGFSGSSNPLFADKHVRLLQADARAALTELHARLISSSDKQNAGA